jgi:hypothetical protein
VLSQLSPSIVSSDSRVRVSRKQSPSSQSSQHCSNPYSIIDLHGNGTSFGPSCLRIIRIHTVNPFINSEMLFKNGGTFAPGSDPADWSQAVRGNKGVNFK